MNLQCGTCCAVVAAAERVAGDRRQWVCGTCGAVLKEEAALARISVKRVTAEQLAAARASDATERAAKALQRQTGKHQAVRPPGSQEKFVIEETNGRIRPAGAPAPASVPRPSFYERVIVADDSALLREIVKDALVQNGLSRHVQCVSNGAELLQSVAESVAAGGRIDLAVMDLEMPVLGGFQSAVALRAIEAGLRLRPMPIFFFTVHEFSSEFQRVLDYCQPARFFTKGPGSTPVKIAEQLVELLSSR